MLRRKIVGNILVTSEFHHRGCNEVVLYKKVRNLGALFHCHYHQDVFGFMETAN